MNIHLKVESTKQSVVSMSPKTGVHGIPTGGYLYALDGGVC